MYGKNASSSTLKLLPAILAGMLLVSACGPVTIQTNPASETVAAPSGDTINVIDSSTPVPAMEVPATDVPATAEPEAQPPTNSDTPTIYGPLSLVIPSTIASGASSTEYPRLDSADAAWWQKTPGHQQVMFGDYYVLQGKFHQAQIYIYPAQGYAELLPPAFESLHRLNNIVGLPNASISSDKLPTVPFFNAQQVFASNIQRLDFQNGKGVRFLTEYAQYAAPINNHDLFYHFQGLTNDGAYYIIAILPITSPVLAETSDLSASLPSGGVAFPNLTDPNANLQGYYQSVTDLLNGQAADSFAPTLQQLDQMIASMLVGR